jgi:hypothetical protein
MNKYEELRRIDVSEKIERKNNLSYLSWAWAVDTLLSNDPMATWSYGEPVKFGETLMVFCTVTAFGKSMTSQLPVMDYRNKAVPNPDSFAVNTAMQRCLAKAIALHGLGLYIYAGEDLPPDDEKNTEKAEETLGECIAKIKASDSPAKLRTAFATLYKQYSAHKHMIDPIQAAYNEMKAKFNETSESAAG